MGFGIREIYKVCFLVERMKKSGVAGVVVLIVVVGFISAAELEIEIDGRVTKWIYNNNSDRVEDADRWEWICDNLEKDEYANWIKPGEAELELFFEEYPGSENSSGMFCYRFDDDSEWEVSDVDDEEAFMEEVRKIEEGDNGVAEKSERGFFGKIWYWFIGLFGYGDSDSDDIGINVPEQKDNPDCPQEKEFVEGLYAKLEDVEGNEFDCIRTCITVAKGGLNQKMLRTFEFGQNLMAMEGEKTCDEHGYSTDYCNVCDYDLSSGDSEYGDTLSDAEGFIAGMKEFNEQMEG
jgi:hypothetical protein